MKAMVLNKPCDLNWNLTPLELVDIPDPVPSRKEILLKVSACGVCHTELDEIEGRIPLSHLPVVLGHQVVGRVEEMLANFCYWRLKWVSSLRFRNLR
ncbi:MAG: alcohol dehydrogenase catalytic domain-containing protein [Desulfobacterales bacterium]